MALIQVLAQSTHGTIRSEDGLTTALRGKPTSKDAPTWISLAEAHREFFRVYSGNVSLISRHVLAKEDDGKSPPLSSDETAKLLELAISLHDREAVRRDRWKPWLIPIITALLLGLFTLGAALVKTSPQILKCP
jgi:hypothetical protein